MVARFTIQLTRASGPTPAILGPFLLFGSRSCTEQSLEMLRIRTNCRREARIQLKNPEQLAMDRCRCFDARTKLRSATRAPIQRPQLAIAYCRLDDRALRGPMEHSLPTSQIESEPTIAPAVWRRVLNPGMSRYEWRGNCQNRHLGTGDSAQGEKRVCQRFARPKAMDRVFRYSGSRSQPHLFSCRSGDWL